MAKGETAHYKQYLLLPQCFWKLFSHSRCVNMCLQLGNRVKVSFTDFPSSIFSEVSQNAPSMSATQPLPSLYKSKPLLEGTSDVHTQKSPEKVGMFKFSEDVSVHTEWWMILKTLPKWLKSLVFIPFPHIDAFLSLCSRRLFENIVTKQEIAQNEQ